MPTIGLLGEQGSDQIPASHRDLVECPPGAALTGGDRQAPERAPLPSAKVSQQGHRRSA